MQTSAPALICPACKTVCVAQEQTCRICGKDLLGALASRTTAIILARVLLGLLTLGIVAAILVGYKVYSGLTQSQAYEDGLSIASSNAEVQTILGSNIHPVFPALGHLMSLEGAEFAEWSVVLSGTKGTGHLYGVADQVNGVWDYSRLVFKSANSPELVNLAPVHRLSLPRVPVKRVYLLPIGLAEAESLDWAPAYYKSKMEIDVTTLPSKPLPSDLVNSQRNQLDSDRCIDEFLTTTYPQLANDPTALLIAVTSKDMYIPTFNWRYAENRRKEGRFAVVSSARLHPYSFLEKMNPEWLHSRLQKLLTKNILILYFDLPMSSDYSSVLSGGVLAGWEIDGMGGDLIGGEKRWDPFIESGSPAVTIYHTPGKDILWNREWAESALPDSAMQLFTVALDIGVVVQRKADFVFADEPAMQFTRVYRNQDDRSRSFGVGASHSFDMFLGGKMGVAVDLIMPDGHRVHFVHEPPKAGQRGDTYLPSRPSYDRFVEAVYLGGTWKVRTTDGWTYLFPYRPNALPEYVTVLTSFLDPAQRKYEMQRDTSGALLAISSPSGAWLHFENDAEHRIRNITASSGRFIRYDYDNAGNMNRATASDGSVDFYTYDDKNQMLTAAHGNEKPFVTNEYFVDGYIKSQTLPHGQSFEYHYSREGGRILNTYITDPNGLQTYIQFRPDGYLEWPPAPVGR